MIACIKMRLVVPPRNTSSRTSWTTRADSSGEKERAARSDIVQMATAQLVMISAVFVN